MNNHTQKAKTWDNILFFWDSCNCVGRWSWAQWAQWPTSCISGRMRQPRSWLALRAWFLAQFSLFPYFVCCLFDDAPKAACFKFWWACEHISEDMLWRTRLDRCFFAIVVWKRLFFSVQGNTFCNHVRKVLYVVLGRQDSCSGAEDSFRSTSKKRSARSHVDVCECIVTASKECSGP